MKQHIKFYSIFGLVLKFVYFDINISMSPYYYQNLSDTQNEIKIIPHRTIQTFYNRYKDGEFAIHFAGMKNQLKRIQLINNHLKKIIK